MKQTQFEQRYQAHWHAFALQLESLEKSQACDPAHRSFASAYRQICQHLALAQARGYSSHLIDHLQRLALRGHRQFYRHRSSLPGQLAGFLLQGFPRLVRQQWRSVLLASLLFYGSLLLMGGLVYSHPELVYSIMEPSQVSVLLPEPQRPQLHRRERDDRRVEPEVALHRALASKRKELNSLVSQYARLKGVPHSHVHADLRRECGGPSLAKASQGEVDERVRAIRASTAEDPSPGMRVDASVLLIRSRSACAPSF